jgi:hypothetical protein
MKMAILFIFYHHGSEGRGIFTIGKCGVKFKILKCSKQTLSPFPQQSTLAPPSLSQPHLSSVTKSHLATTGSRVRTGGIFSLVLFFTKVPFAIFLMYRDEIHQRHLTYLRFLKTSIPRDSFFHLT